MTIKVKIDASQKSETSIFAIPIKEEMEINDVNEISDFIVNNGYNFSSFTLMSGEVELMPVGKLENIEGQFVTDDGKNFYIAKNMIYGRKLKEYNRESKSFDKGKGLATQLSRGGTIRITELQKIKNIINKPIELKIQKPNEETIEDFQILNEIEKNRHRSCSCTGHRPDKLGGYEMKNPTMLQLKNRLLEVLERLITKEGIDIFYSGGALGGDAAFFWCVHILKKKYPHIKNILAIPFKYQHIRWSKEQQEWYKKMLYHADEVINVELLKEYTTNQHLLLETDTNFVKLGYFSGMKMQRRNEFMIDYTGRTVCIWNGERKAKSGTWNTVRYALTETGNILIQLNPEKSFEDSVVERN